MLKWSVLVSSVWGTPLERSGISFTMGPADALLSEELDLKTPVLWLEKGLANSHARALTLRLPL